VGQSTPSEDSNEYTESILKDRDLPFKEPIYTGSEGMGITPVFTVAYAAIPIPSIKSIFLENTVFWRTK